MKILKFTLSGRTAFFKKPDVNSYFYFTYGQIHKVALLGIFGSILGLKGYTQSSKDDVYPEFYEKLKGLLVSVIPKSKNGYFHKKINVFNNSVGYASKQEGGNLIIREQWLEHPSWDIYVRIDSAIAEDLSAAIQNKSCAYIPYLGKNDHMADVSDVCLIEDVETIREVTTIDSLFPKESVILELDDDEIDYPFKYEELLPIGLDPDMNLYIFQSFIYTNLAVEEMKCEAVNVKGKNLIFY